MIVSPLFFYIERFELTYDFTTLEFYRPELSIKGVTYSIALSYANIQIQFLPVIAPSTYVYSPFSLFLDAISLS